MLESSIGISYNIKLNTLTNEYEFFKDGKLEPNNINKLYKFLSFNENTIAGLLGGYFYLANPATFNDPFDCNKTLIVDYQEKEEHKKNQRRNYFDDIGIISLTEKLNNPLMWAHYTNNYNGIVLEIDTSSFHKCSNPLQYEKYKLRKVIYPEYIGPLQTGFKFAEDVMLSAKIKHWEYEQEWRIIGKLKEPYNRYFGYDLNIIKNIYIGYNLLEYNGSAIQILAHIRDIRYPNANLYTVHPHPNEYGKLLVKTFL